MRERLSSAYISSLRQEIAQIRQEASDHEGRLSTLAFSAAQSNESVLQRMKESEALLDEPSTSSVENQTEPRKKKKPPTEVPLFTFHGGSSDGDGGAPTSQGKRDAWRHKQHKEASARTLSHKAVGR